MEKRVFYKVSRESLLRLIKAELQLAALENGGVDNWTWYGDSLQDFLEDRIAESDLAEFIRDMEEEGNVGYGDDFDYSQLAEWDLGGYVKCED